VKHILTFNSSQLNFVVWLWLRQFSLLFHKIVHFFLGLIYLLHLFMPQIPRDLPYQSSSFSMKLCLAGLYPALNEQITISRLIRSHSTLIFLSITFCCIDRLNFFIEIIINICNVHKHNFVCLMLLAHSRKLSWINCRLCSALFG